MKVAVVQFKASTNKETNLKKIINYISKAAQNKASLEEEVRLNELGKMKIEEMKTTPDEPVEEKKPAFGHEWLPKQFIKYKK